MKAIFLSVLLILCSPLAKADDCRMDRQASLPMTFSRFLPTVPVSLNGREFNMGVDIGAQGMLVTPETAAQLNLPQDSRHSTHAIGANGNTTVSNVLIEQVEFAGQETDEVSVPVLSLESASATPAPPVAGLIGADILSQFDIDFDVPDRMMTLYRVSGCDKISPPWTGSYASVPILVTGSRRIAVPVQLDGHPITAIFDTGASGERLARSSASRVGLTSTSFDEDPSAAITSVGGQRDNVPVHRFEQIKIGPETFHGPKIQIADFPANEADMLIGEDYMHARRFWISYETRTLLIQPRPAPKPAPSAPQQN